MATRKKAGALALSAAALALSAAALALSAAAVALPLVLAAPAGAHAAVAPKGLAFYSPPVRLLAGKPGTVIWTRRVSTPAALAAAASRTTLVLYRSVLPNGKPTAVSGVVFTPRGTAPRRGWKLISWAHGTTGIADSCAPSRGLATSYVYPQFSGWLKRGYAIAQSDYQGLGTPGTHLYLVGRAEGASVLDIALAARRLDPGIGRRFAIAGHSQGGQAALFAAALAGHDARMLKLVGVAAFAPASHITTQFKAAAILSSPGGALTALGGMILSSAGAASPSVDLHALLTPRAFALLPAVQHECLGALAQASSWGGLAPDQIERRGANTTALYRVLDAMNPALRIGSPVLIVQGLADTTVFPAFTGQLDRELVGLGDRVRYATLPGVDHASAVQAGFKLATAALGNWFR